MPIYEYQCGNCGHHLEALQRLSDAPLKKCPECGRPTLRKLVSAAGFRLKGGGWYETDFKSGKKHNLAGAGDAPPAEAKDKKEGTEKKAAEPAKKTEPAVAKKQETRTKSEPKQAKIAKAE